jgi:hypothetical protein
VGSGAAAMVGGVFGAMMTYGKNLILGTKKWLHGLWSRQGG